MKRDNEERSSSRALGDHGEEFGVNGTEVVVMDAVSDGNSLVTLFPASRFSINMPELGASVHGVPRHLQTNPARNHWLHRLNQQHQ